jgi:hypothetical protein
VPGFFGGLESSSSSLLSIRFLGEGFGFFVPLSWWTEGDKLFELGGTRTTLVFLGKKMMAVKCLQVQWSLWNLPGYETSLGGSPWRQQQHQQLRGSGRRMQIGRSQWSRHHSVRSSMSGGCAARAGGNVSQSDANDNAEDLASSSSDAWQDGVLSEEEKRVRWKTRNSSSLSSSAAEAAAEEMRFPAADMFQVIQSSKDSRFDIDYLGESTKGDMNVRPDIVDNFGESLFLFGPQNPQFLLYKVD